MLLDSYGFRLSDHTEDMEVKYIHNVISYGDRVEKLYSQVSP